MDVERVIREHVKKKLAQYDRIRSGKAVEQERPIDGSTMVVREGAVEYGTRYAVILFCDISHYTDICLHLGTRDHGRFLTEYFSTTLPLLLEHGATIDKLLGDGIMAFWSSSTRDPELVRQSLQAVSNVLDVESRVLQEMLSGTCPFKVNTHTGMDAGMVSLFSQSVVPGVELGKTIIGTSVNLAAKLCDEAIEKEVRVGPAVREAASSEWHHLFEKVADHTCKYPPQFRFNWQGYVRDIAKGGSGAPE